MTKNLLARGWAAAPKILCLAYISKHQRSDDNSNTVNGAWMIIWVTLAGCFLGLLLLLLVLPDRFFLPEADCVNGRNRNGLFDQNDQALSIHRSPSDENGDRRPCQARFLLFND